MVKFIEQGHEYSSIVKDGIEWISVTKLCSNLEKPFDDVAQAAKSTKNPRSKWYNIPVDEILVAWRAENKRSIDLGHKYHATMEQQLLAHDYIDGLKVHKPIIVDGIKLAPEQRLSEGIYPEHMVYLQSVGITGQSDKVTVKDSVVDIDDHKTSKEILRESYKNWEGQHKMMLKPLHHLQDCHFNHYALQLSIYMYCVLRHNPLMTPGKLRINHVKFEETGKDKYGYPLTLIDSNGEPVVKDIEVIELPYLKSEVNTVINWIKDTSNRDKVIKHK